MLSVQLKPNLRFGIFVKAMSSPVGRLNNLYGVFGGSFLLLHFTFAHSSCLGVTWENALCRNQFSKSSDNLLFDNLLEEFLDSHFTFSIAYEPKV